MRSFKTEGVILKRTNVGEADRLLTVFTKHYGKIKALARGVRRITSRRGGNVEVFTHATMFFSEGRNLDILTEAETIHSFQVLRKNLLTVAYAYKVCELIDRLTAEKQEHENIYRLLVNTLAMLNSPITPNSHIIVNFESEIVKILGFWPQNKPFTNINIETFIESITERELKSKKFLQRLKDRY